MKHAKDAAAQAAAKRYEDAALVMQTRARPDWMSDPSRLPKRPPTTTRAPQRGRERRP
jgi:hypothetical protein